MIYVIANSEFKEGSLTEHETVLKIGYTDDKKSKKRFQAYRTHSYSYKILYKIKGGTKSDEQNLHHYFESYKIIYEGKPLREWFKFDNFIIDFFNTHTTLESIRKDIKEFIHPKKRDSIYNIRKIIRPYVLSVQDIIGVLDETIYDGCSDATIEYAENWINTHYKDQSKEILDYHKKVQSSITPKMKEFIEYLQDTRIEHLSDRLKNLCNNSEFTSEEKKIIARQASERFDQYYNIVGPNRCAELGYNTTYIRNEIKNLSLDMDEDQLLESIYNEFLIDHKYSSVYIKSKLKEIYERCNITKTPKSTDLNEYFKTKRIQILYPDKKKDNGFKILSLKEQ
jgi:hypothetical protein